MANTFSPGDIVKLKSGGPAMTISKVQTDSLTGEFKGYRCEWFKGASKESAFFEEETLQTYVAPKTA
jgi:uncharacterized protein YodC (DUF2158 family)